MKKQDLIAAIADKTGTTRKVAADALDALIGSITDALAQDGKIALLGFGTFTVKERAARQGRNPQTGEAMEIAPGKSISFKAGKDLKDAVTAADSGS